MSIEIVAGAGDEGLPISEAVRAGDFVFVSGLVGFDTGGKIVSGGIGVETEEIFRHLKEILTRVGAGLHQIAKVNVYITDAGNFDEFNMIYKRYFPNNPPARICVVSQLTIEALVELDCTVYLSQ